MDLVMGRMRNCRCERIGRGIYGEGGRRCVRNPKTFSRKVRPRNEGISLICDLHGKMG